MGRRPITDLDELKTIELGIMKQIHQFCTQRQIRYCLTFGTLLGAIRHRGFIPWDDDIDIFMPRPDFDRFIREFEEFGRSRHLYVASDRTEHYLARTFLQVCDARTELTEPWSREDRPRGVFVDVWPLDGLPDAPLARKIHEVRARILKKALALALVNVKTATGYGPLKKIIIQICGILDYKKVEKRFDRVCRKYPYENGKYIASFASVFHRYERTQLEHLEKAPFEDAEFIIPAQYHALLTEQYGDYMQLPPQSKRKPHHIVNIFWAQYDHQ